MESWQQSVPEGMSTKSEHLAVSSLLCYVPWCVSTCIVGVQTNRSAQLQFFEQLITLIIHFSQILLD